MAIQRMGYAHIRVTDLAEAREHYTETLGLDVVAEEEGKLYLKAWDEWEHHSVVLEEGGVGLVKFGFRAENDEDLAEVEAKAQQFGMKTERLSKGEELEVGEIVRLHAPSGHTFDIYHEMTHTGLAVGNVNPEAFPRHGRGVNVSQLDHALITAPDVALMERMLHEVFGFWTAEQVATSLDENDQHKLAVWTTGNNLIHQLAVLEGPEGKLHHYAFRLEEGWEVTRAADIFSMDDVPIDVGPTRHGITRGKTVYFFDPAGNRNETFSGGYMAYRDRPKITWTVDQLGKGIFYHARELNERFTTVLT